MHHIESHRFAHVGWLRAAVLGANDGIVSTASLLLGIAAAGNVSNASLLVAGFAGLVAGAMSMAAGEYISVSTQKDTEQADLAREREELANDDAHERQELTDIYIGRGLDPELAKQVCEQLMAHDALGAHARDELGILEITRAQPMVAALTSALSFAAGALLPLLVAMLATPDWLNVLIVIISTLSLALLGALAAWFGGANAFTGAARVTFWGLAAMLLTYLIGSWVGAIVL